MNDSDLDEFIVGEVIMDTNNMSGFKYDTSCTYSKTGDCVNCCIKEQVFTP